MTDLVDEFRDLIGECFSEDRTSIKLALLDRHIRNGSLFNVNVRQILKLYFEKAENELYDWYMEFHVLTCNLVEYYHPIINLAALNELHDIWYRMEHWKCLQRSYSPINRQKLRVLIAEREAFLIANGFEPEDDEEGYFFQDEDENEEQMH